MYPKDFELSLEELLGMSEETFKQFVTKMPAEERLVGLAPEDRLAGLAPEQLQQMIKQIEAYLEQPSTSATISSDPSVMEKRQTLLHVLRHRFGELPVNVAQRIEATIDRQQLTDWLDVALDATSLSQVEDVLSVTFPTP